jgi:hypothetical protein
MASSELRVSVHGHHRSGTHYLRQLVPTNFAVNMLNDKHHSLPEAFLKDGRKAIYIHRDFDDVAKSIWDIRERFGAGAETFELFKDTPWCEQFCKFNPLIMKAGTPNGRVTTPMGTSATYKEEALSPREYHSLHVTAWEECQHESVLLVAYENLVSFFEDEMHKIAEFLGESRDTFEDLPRVGVWKAGSEIETVGKSRERYL